MPRDSQVSGRKELYQERLRDSTAPPDRIDRAAVNPIAKHHRLAVALATNLERGNQVGITSEKTRVLVSPMDVIIML